MGIDKQAYDGLPVPSLGPKVSITVTREQIKSMAGISWRVTIYPIYMLSHCYWHKQWSCLPSGKSK